MATRESLNKLNLSSLKILAAEHNIEVEKKKKERIISDILTEQVPSSTLTPIIKQAVLVGDVMIPSEENENLPPFNRVTYTICDQTKFPIIKFAHIYDFMVTRPTYSGTTTQNFKGLDKAVKHYDAGDIQEVGMAQINEQTIYIRAMCQASMKKQRYQVYICTLKTDSGDFMVQYGYCQCPIGLAQSCSHIGSLLFALSRAKVGITEAESCTSKSCTWNVPRKDVQPRPLCYMASKKPKLASSSEEGNAGTSETGYTTFQSFDPRHTADRTVNLDLTLQHLMELKNVFPNTGMSHLWNIPESTPDVHQEVEMDTWVDPMERKMKEMLYTENNLPPPSIERELVDYIESNTRLQRGSTVWRDLHKGRITSSIFGDVMAAGRSPNSLIRQITEGSSLDRYSSLPQAIQWGVDNEDRARAQYIELKQCMQYDDFKVETAGLTLNNIYSFLGATSDGIVIEGDSVGLLEIKCPFSLKGVRVNTLEINTILGMNDPSFCLISTPDGPTLNPFHKYYAQVQGEMAIKELPWCDFVLWTAAKENNICIDRVYFNAEFVQNMLQKLVKFYMDNIFPCFYQ
ncbi:unnamed protein product [Mytilus edulis]|uniref:YqaJ viral recombinase domain-containing protein n=1 Tax=Mytilus edulis TaxID=6550 RepID=A0A8S3PY39_MYTED|nr:unnamed protein product [Mytilus edulis]